MSNSKIYVIYRGHKKMKIDELTQNPAVVTLINARTDKSAVADARAETAGKQHAAADKVELSSYMPVPPASKVRQDDKVSRVAEIKAQMKDGSYQVSGRAVAEKMLSKIVMKTA
jgi:negative regulator of flagellin synthesis FlgM